LRSCLLQVTHLLQLLRRARVTAKTFGQKLSASDWSLSSVLGLGPSVDYNASRFYNSDPYDDVGNRFVTPRLIGWLLFFVIRNFIRWKL